VTRTLWQKRKKMVFVSRLVVPIDKGPMILMGCFETWGINFKGVRSGTYVTQHSRFGDSKFVEQMILKQQKKQGKK
jgi:hypothetical protein